MSICTLYSGEMKEIVSILINNHVCSVFFVFNLCQSTWDSQTQSWSSYDGGPRYPCFRDESVTVRDENEIFGKQSGWGMDVFETFDFYIKDEMHPLLLTACHFPIWVSQDKVGCTEYRNTILKTRTSIVVRNAGCAHSRYTRKLSLIFF